MTFQALRFRRAITAATSLYPRSLASPFSTVSCSSDHGKRTLLASSLAALLSQPRLFSPTCVSFFSSYSLNPPRVWKEGEEITPDMVLFEGCDYNHWLITVDFPKDNKPSSEEMVRVYEETCAKGLNISVEEAKKRMYACSTTTYEGFQVLMTEEESEKFKDVPGVVFILPDSYIDPVNKEYGGDKYENGVITHRPPPVQYQKGGRFRDQRGPPRFERPRYDQRGPPNMQYNQQGDGRNYGPSQDHAQQQRYNSAPQQNYGPPQQNYGPPQPNYRPHQPNVGPPQQNYGPSQPNVGPPQQNYGPSQPNVGPPQQNYGPSHPNVGPPQQNYGPSQPNVRPPQQSYGTPTQATNNNSYSPSGNIPMAGNYNTQDEKEFAQGNRRDYDTFSRQGNMNSGQVQGPNPGYSQRSSNGEAANQGHQSNYEPMQQTGSDQGRY